MPDEKGETDVVVVAVSKDHPEVQLEDRVGATTTAEQQVITRSKWERMVLLQHRNLCVNCGGNDRLRVHMVVPEEAGGRLVDENGIVLCRTCEMAKEAVERGAHGADRRLINFWVSRRFHTRIEESLRLRNGFVSLGNLVRYLMTKFVGDPERFDDIERYQDFGGADVKLNVWVEPDTYEGFKTLLEQRRMTVTDAVKALLQLYDEETIVLSAGHSTGIRLHG